MFLLQCCKSLHLLLQCSKKSNSSNASKKPKEKVRKPKDLNKFIKECIKSHNEFRKKHSSPPLKQNKRLTAHAQKYAEHLAATNTFAHSSDKFKGKNVGENLAAKSSGGHDVDYTGDYFVLLRPIIYY